MKADDMLAGIQKAIEQRISAQLARHIRIDPLVDTSRVIDIQIGQEREKLAKLADRYEEQEQDKLAEACRVLSGEWLSQLAHDLKRRR